MFKDNYAYYEGGAISSSDIYPDHSMYLTNCCFVSNSTNTTDGGGGAICMAWDDDTQIVNCVFTGNEAHNGGAVQMGRNDDKTRLTNCTFYDNEAKSGGDGGALWASLASPQITNCILWGNTAGGDGNDIFLTSTAKNTTFRHCDVNECGGSGGGWDPNFGTDGGWNTEGDPCFAIDDPDWPVEDGPEGADGAWGTDDDGLMLGPDSACINAAAFRQPMWVDVTGRVRKIVSPYPDIGAYESKYKIILAMCFIDETEGASYYTYPTKYIDDMDDFDALLASLPTNDYSIVKAGCIVPACGVPNCPYTGCQGNLADVLPAGFFNPDPVPDYVKAGDPPVGISIAECGRPPDGNELIVDFHHIREGRGPDCILRVIDISYDSMYPLEDSLGWHVEEGGYDDFEERLKEWLKDHGLDPGDSINNGALRESYLTCAGSECERWIEAITDNVNDFLAQ